jgi:glycosyltransferase involved in cell wall biosynthesis
VKADRRARVAIYHNILWSKYKGQVFSKVYLLAQSTNIDVSFVQIAETEGSRAKLGEVDFSYHNYPYRLLFKGSYENVSTFRKMWALIKDVVQHRADVTVIPGYERPEFWAMLIACMILGRKRGVFCDSTVYDRSRIGMKEFAKRFFFSRCDVFFCYGVRSKEYLLSYGVNFKRIRFRVQAAALPHDYDKQLVMQYYQVRRERVTGDSSFLYIGRLSVEKGLYDVIDAIRLLRERWGNATLKLVGAGPIREALEARVNELGLDDAIEFLGTREIKEIEPLLLQATALVLPSHSEPWGLVVNEALSYGCPVVVSNVCGCVPELVIDGSTGYAFDMGDAQAMAAAMSKVVDEMTDRAAVAQNCLEVIERYSPENAASEILDGCLAVINNRI